jgi:hypothetical protein
VKFVDWRARKPFDDNVEENANSEMHSEGGREAEEKEEAFLPYG